MSYVSIFVVTVFSILFFSLAVTQLRKLGTKTPRAFPFMTPPDNLPPDRPIHDAAEVSDVVTQEHYQGRHAAAQVIGCRACEAEFVQAIDEQAAAERGQALLSRPYGGEVTLTAQQQQLDLQRQQHPVNGYDRDDNHITTRVSPRGHVEIRVPFDRGTHDTGPG